MKKLSAKLTTTLNILLVGISLSACGQVGVNGEVKGHVDPVEVNHKISIDTTTIYNFFLEECRSNYSDPVDISQCADDKLNNLFASFSNL